MENEICRNNICCLNLEPSEQLRGRMKRCAGVWGEESRQEWAGEMAARWAAGRALDVRVLP